MNISVPHLLVLGINYLFKVFQSTVQCKELPSWVGSISRFVVVALGQQYWGRISVFMAVGSIKGSQGQRKSEIEVDLENENKITIINMY